MFDIPAFRIRFPEYADETAYPDAVLNVMAEDAICLIGSNANRWCGKYDIVLAYLVAHLLTLRLLAEAGGATEAAPSGAIISKTAHNVAVTYQQGTALTQADTFYNGTRYGQFFLTLRQQCFGATSVVAHDVTGYSGCMASGNFRDHTYHH